MLTTTLNVLKTGLLALVLACSSITMTPAVALATTEGSRANYENPGKHLGHVPSDVVSEETAPVATTETNEGVALSQETQRTSETQAATVSARTAQTTNAPSADPRGNNGTVKIDRTPFDSHPDNQPHVTCSFQVDFYGYDAGVGNASVNFALQNPTKTGRTLTVTSGDPTPNIGQDAASGGTDLDASETYTLGFTGAPHNRQGYHVKLTVHAPGSQGSDVKHKVFWVQPCAESGGHVLGETNSTTPAKTLPTNLPSTGMSAAYLATLLTVMILAYRGTYVLLARRVTEIDS